VSSTSSSLQLIGQVLICCFCSREPARPVKDGTLGTGVGLTKSTPIARRFHSQRVNAKMSSKK